MSSMRADHPSRVSRFAAAFVASWHSPQTLISSLFPGPSGRPSGGRDGIVPCLAAAANTTVVHRIRKLVAKRTALVSPVDPCGCKPEYCGGMSTGPSSRYALALLISTALFCGVQAQGVPPGGQTGGRQGGGRGNAPVAYDDYTGYTKLWDGATFTNWEGETDVWSIQDGMIHADTTKTPGQHHIYYTGPGAVMRDFDLKVEVKISAAGANGGIQYRSRLLHPAHGGSIADPLGGLFLLTSRQ